MDLQQGPPNGLQNPFWPWFWHYFDIVSSIWFLKKRLSKNQPHRIWGIKMLAEYLLFLRYVSMYLCIYVSMYLCIYVSMYLCIYVSMYLCIVFYCILFYSIVLYCLHTYIIYISLNCILLQETTIPLQSSHLRFSPIRGTASPASGHLPPRVTSATAASARQATGGRGRRGKRGQSMAKSALKNSAAEPARILVDFGRQVGWNWTTLGLGLEIEKH